MSFVGFDPRAVALLAEMPTWDADEYATRKDQLRAGVVAPGLALVEELAALLDAPLSVSRRGSVSPLHRDLRFAPAGAPRYKDHLLLTTWEGPDKKSSPILWIRVDAVGVGFASGMGFTPMIRERWRAAVGGASGEVLAAGIERLVVERDAEVAGEQVVRVPAPYPSDHPRESLLRRTGFQVRFTDVPATLGDPALAGWCLERLEALLPIHRWLVDELGGT